MFPFQMGEKRKTVKGITFLVFHFFRIVKTSLFPSPGWTLQAEVMVILEMGDT